MPRQAFSTPAAPDPVGPYSQSVRIANVVAAAGQCGVRPDGTRCQGIEDQTRQALDNLAATLGAAGAGLDDVIQARVFLVDREDFAPMNAVYAEYFSDPPPARTTLYVGLPGDLLVEIDVLAVQPAQ
jgi:2-iminobutanoate/2-iminopropanoate deaminase